MLRLQAYDPWRELRAIQRQMDEVFRGFVPDARRSHSGYGPAFNVYEEGSHYIVEAELPGVNKDDLNIEATGNSVTIRGKRAVKAPEGYSVHRRERGNLEFARTVSFEGKLDLEKISASLHDGVLRLELHKQPEAQPRQISIKA